MNDSKEHVPSLGAIELIEQAEYLDSLYEPPVYESYAAAMKRIRASLPRKKKRKKQMKIETAVKNMKKPPTNFQGMPLEKCTDAPELGVAVFIHPNYTKAWTKRQKEATFIPMPNDNKVCPHCFCLPCSARLLEEKLECDACTVEDLIRLDEEGHREKLRFFYRIQLSKLQGKRFVTRQMKTNNHIPACAKAVTAKIASIEAGGYDSMVEQNPFQAKATICKNKRTQSALELDSESSDEEFCFE